MRQRWSVWTYVLLCASGAALAGVIGSLLIGESSIRLAAVLTLISVSAITHHTIKVNSPLPFPPWALM